MNPDAMLEVMPFRVWRNWLLYEEVEPFGEERADLRAAIVAWSNATYAVSVSQMGRNDKRRALNKIKLEDFLPQFKPRKIVQKSPDQLFEQVKMMNRLLGGTFVDKRKTNGGQN